MKNIIVRLMNNQRVLSVLALSVVTVSTLGANARCVAFFHDVEKPAALDALKKY